MRFKQDNIKKKLLPGVFLLAVFLLILVLPASLQAAQYYVWGRVYSASLLAEGEDVPNNPLTGVPVDQVIGDNMVAQIPRNLVNVRVIAAADGSELGNHIVTQDGGYLVFINTTGPSVSIKFIVEELATSKVLLESAVQELIQWPNTNMRYLLIAEDLTGIGDDREFADCPSCGPGQYTGIFTRVGKIEVATNVGGSPTHLIDYTSGLVDIPPAVASDLKIPQYEDAPLAGNLYMFGAFSQDLYSTSDIYYRIIIEDLSTSTTTYMDDPLVKTRYTVDLTASPPTVVTDRITLGPKTVNIGGTDYHNCYDLTPMSAGNVFWSFPDLLALWRTGGLNGSYKLTLQIIDASSATPDDPPEFIETPHYTDLRVELDNISPVARILPLDSSSTGVPPLTDDTPLIYTPGTAVTSYDLLLSMLGSDTNYGPATNPICAILELETPGQHLAFKLTAHHTNGFMRYWYFSFKRNNGGYNTIIGKKYNGGTNLMEDYSPVKIPLSGYTGDDGFQDKYLYLNGGHIDLSSPDGCGYRFVIRSATRATDGYQYLHYSSDEDIHYIQQQ